MERTFAKFDKNYRGCRILQDTFVCGRNLEEELLHELHVAQVTHAHRNAKPYLTVAMTPVHDAPRYQLGVGNDAPEFIIRKHGGASGANPYHSPDGIPNFDAMTQLDGPLSQDNQAADE